MHSAPLAIVAALNDEIKIIRSKMEIDTRVHVRPSLFEEGTYLKKSILLVRSGLGQEAMKTAISYCFTNFHPEFCLHIGYCGGTDPQFQAGDLIIANLIVDAASLKQHKPDASIIQKAQKLCNNKGLRARIGGLVTVKDVIGTPHEKAFVGTEHEASGIDMESSAFALECGKRSIPYLVVRSVFDPLDVSLPSLNAVDQEGKTDGMALAKHFARNPKDILAIPRIEYFATQARNSITAFVDAWLENTEAI